METMKQDEKVILYEFGFDDIEGTIEAANKQLLPNERAHKTTLLYEDLWKQVPAHMITTLQEIYKYDFEMFDYPTDPFKS